MFMDCTAKAKELVAKMTLEEKASLCGGKNFWNTKGVERLGIPEVMVTDGPHGLRKQDSAADNLGINNSVPATCFPTASASACSFDRELLGRVGKAMGEECCREDVAVILGPGVNMKRNPLCGRNFEYFSEDPCLAGELAAAMVNGIQSNNVGVSVKHFALNSQECRRMSSESVCDERTAREIYLAAFERVVKKAKPWTLMCAYNKIFGKYCSDNKWLLTDVLRNEWGFDGMVMSDWGAVNDRVEAVKAGLDLQMPGSTVYDDSKIVAAVRSGKLDEKLVDRCAENVTAMVLKSTQRVKADYDKAAHHALAREAASKSAVLLKNEGHILPVDKNSKLAVIGGFAKSPRYQGAGSSKINPTELDNAFDELKKLGLEFDYADGYSGEGIQPDSALISAACETAKGKDAVIIFAGLPDSFESEGFDRKNINMPDGHIELIKEIAKVNKNVVVVLSGGSVMDVLWENNAKAILLCGLGGQAGAGAAADLLTGKVNPSGKLAETWPLRLEDTPSFANFPGGQRTVEYRESIYIGYRYYDCAKAKVRYEFGYGLSYTDFEYSDITLSTDKYKNGDKLTVGCTVKNIGEVAGAETVQLYVSQKNPIVFKAEKELKGFEKVFLEPGEQKTISFELESRDFAFYDVKAGKWCVENGDYEILIGASSRNIKLTAPIECQSDDPAPMSLTKTIPSLYDVTNGIHVTDTEFRALLGRDIPAAERKPGEVYTSSSTLTDIQDKALGRFLMKTVKKEMGKMMAGNDDLKPMFDAMIADMPLRSLSLSGAVDGKTIEGLVDMLNGHYIKGIKLIKK